MDVRFESAGIQGEGYFAVPKSGDAPGLVVIQEWWGLVPHIREVCDRFAADGFLALAPDLFHGATTTEPDEANKLMMELDFPRAIAEIVAAIDFLRRHDAGNGKVGVTGFCMGGALTLATAASADPDAAVPFYGIPSQPIEAGAIACPVLGHWAEHDGWATQAAGNALFERLRDEGVDATLHLYPGTEHAFFNDHRPEVYDREAAETAYARTVEFLRARLG